MALFLASSSNNIMGSIICSILPMASVPLHMAKPVLCPHALMATEGQKLASFDRLSWSVLVISFFLLLLKSKSISVALSWSFHLTLFCLPYRSILALSLSALSLSPEISLPLSHPFCQLCLPIPLSNTVANGFENIQYDIEIYNLRCFHFTISTWLISSSIALNSPFSLFVIHSFLVTTIINVTGKTKANMIDFKSNQV